MTHFVQFSEVEEYLRQDRRKLSGILDAMEKELFLAREEGLPIYSTKIRVKSAESIFIKCRKNGESIEKCVRDVAGMRILCLYEADIYEVHEWVLKYLSENESINLVSFKMFNYDEMRMQEEIYSTAMETFGRERCENIPKVSGYRSIHYVVKYVVQSKEKVRYYPLEIQLRTLLQDIWGELEHSFSYKSGEVNNHLKSSFRILSRDLNNSDAMLNHLRGIGKQEEYKDLSSRSLLDSLQWLPYEDDEIPAILKEGAHNVLWKRYEEHIKKRKACNDRISWADELEIIYGEIVTVLLNGTKREYDQARHWVAMEKGYILLCKGEFREAVAEYASARGRTRDSYIACFRSGQAHHALGNRLQAMRDFDECEKLCEVIKGPSKHYNVFVIEKYLAKFYWQMGREMLKLSTDKISAAETALRKSTIDVPEEALSSLYNGKCWYNLEYYLYLKETVEFKTRLGKDIKRDDELNYKEYLKVAEESYNNLFSLDSKYIRDYYYDTAAWLCYNKYLADKSQDLWLLKAKNYSQMQIASEKNRIVNFKMESIRFDRRHAIDNALKALKPETVGRK